MLNKHALNIRRMLHAKRSQPGTLAKFGGLAVLVCVVPFAHAQSEPAYTNAPAIIRAGPSEGYPAVAQLQGGTPMRVLGCVQGYTWCDVSLPGLRGWVYGGNIDYAYQGSPVPLLRYGPEIGLPIIGFSFGAYWGDHYRAQPWYGERSRWQHIGPPPPPPRGEWRGGGPEWHGGPPPGPRQEWHGGPPGQREEWHGGPPQGQHDAFRGGPGPAPHQEPHNGPPQAGGGHPPEGPRGGGGGGHPPEGPHGGGGHPPEAPHGGGGGHPPEGPHGGGGGDDHRGPPH